MIDAGFRQLVDSDNLAHLWQEQRLSAPPDESADSSVNPLDAEQCGFGFKKIVRRRAFRTSSEWKGNIGGAVWKKE
jgi:hypothetical protein